METPARPVLQVLPNHCNRSAWGNHGLHKTLPSHHRQHLHLHKGIIKPFIFFTDMLKAQEWENLIPLHTWISSDHCLDLQWKCVLQATKIIAELGSSKELALVSRFSLQKTFLSYSRPVICQQSVIHSLLYRSTLSETTTGCRAWKKPPDSAKPPAVMNNYIA